MQHHFSTVAEAYKMDGCLGAMTPPPALTLTIWGNGKPQTKKYKEARGGQKVGDAPLLQFVVITMARTHLCSVCVMLRIIPFQRAAM